jgi:hypothetical protein
MPKGDPVLMWTVYDHPEDYPEGYIARLWEVHASGPIPTGHTMSGRGDFGLHLVRRFIQQQGFDACLTRNEEDDPAILETWL